MLNKFSYLWKIGGGALAVVLNLLIFLLISGWLSLPSSWLANIHQSLAPTLNSRKIVELTNKQRTQYGLNALAANYQLDRAAEEKWRDMVQRGYFAHFSPEGVSPWFWVEKNGYSYLRAGENLALGFSRELAIVEAWMLSSTHRANILSKNFREIGLATGWAEIGESRGVLVVQMFGQPRLTAARPTEIAAGGPILSPVPSQPVLPTPLKAGPSSLKRAPINQPEKTPVIFEEREETAGQKTPAAIGLEKIITIEEPKILDIRRVYYSIFAFILAAGSLLTAAIFSGHRRYWWAGLQTVIFLLAIWWPAPSISGFIF